MEKLSAVRFPVDVSVDVRVCVVSEERVMEEDVLGRGNCGVSFVAIVDSDVPPKCPITLGRLMRQCEGVLDATVVASVSRGGRCVNNDAAKMEARL